MNNYADIKRLAEARELVTSSFGGYYEHNASLQEDGSVKLHKGNFAAVYYPNGLVGLMNSHADSTFQSENIDAFPDRVGWLAYTGPRKEYISVIGEDGVKRYYLQPKLEKDGSPYNRWNSELLLQPHPTLNYVPVTPLQDYRITVSRKQKKDALARWQPFFKYADTIWDMLTIGTETRLPLSLSPVADKEEWFKDIQFYKNKGFNGKDAMRNAVEATVMANDLPYNVELVPNTKTDHTSHWSWDLVDKLDKAGRLPRS